MKKHSTKINSIKAKVRLPLVMLLGVSLLVYAVEIPSQIPNVIQYVKNLVITDNGRDDGTSLIEMRENGEISIQPGALRDATVMEEDLNFPIQHIKQGNCPAGYVMTTWKADGTIECSQVGTGDINTGEFSQIYQQKISFSCPDYHYAYAVTETGQVLCREYNRCHDGVLVNWTNGHPAVLSPSESTIGYDSCTNAPTTEQGKLNLEALSSCPSGWLLQGFNPDNSAICVRGVMAAGGTDCITGQIIESFDANGDANCESLTQDVLCETAGLTNMAFYNNTTAYTITQTWDGTQRQPSPVATTAGYNASPNNNTCEFKCVAGYHEYNGQCISNSCQGATPSTSTYVLGDSSYTSGPLQSWTRVATSTATLGTCDYKCKAGTHRNGSSCVANTITSTCTGKPAYSHWTAPSGVATNGNFSASCATDNCSYNPALSSCVWACDAGYVQVGGVCKGFSRDTGTYGSCSANPTWSSSAWSTCSETCGGGTQTRTNTCNNTSGTRSRTVVCKDEAGTTVADSYCTSYASPTTKPVTSESCTESCTTTQPATSQSCNTQACAVDGGRSVRTLGTTCSVSCGGGTYTDTRTCTNPTPANGGADCVGSTTKTDRTCNTQACAVPVNGACSTTAGTCTAGTVSSDNGSTACGTTRTWSCVGSNGGTTASCSKANAVCPTNGVCSATVGVCTEGTASNDNNATACGTTRTRDCVGSNGGSTVNCSDTNPACASCTTPWGATVVHGASVTAFSASTVACGSSCSSISETRTCNNGTLGGSYTNGSCISDSCTSSTSTSSSSSSSSSGGGGECTVSNYQTEVSESIPNGQGLRMGIGYYQYTYSAVVGGVVHPYDNSQPIVKFRCADMYGQATSNYCCGQKLYATCQDGQIVYNASYAAGGTAVGGGIMQGGGTAAQAHPDFTIEPTPFSQTDFLGNSLIMGRCPY